MNRYYLLMDYLIPVYTKEMADTVGMIGPLNCSNKEKIEYYKNHSYADIPNTKCILKIDDDLKLYVAYFNIDVGHFVIKSNSRKKAYDIATLLRSIFILFCGWQLDERTGYYYLQELKRLPKPDWDNNRMINELREFIYDTPNNFINELYHGCGVMYDAYENIVPFIKSIWGNFDIIDALNHLLESRFLFAGYMVGSYYTCHYSREREMTPNWELEKSYFENRYRYETAYIAAFKGIERFFGVNDIKKNKIKSILNTRSNFGITPETEYIRYYEIFSGHKQTICYEKLICHFLEIRNIVAAHGNKNPPEKAKIIEDNIYEIQLFLFELINKVIDYRE